MASRIDYHNDPNAPRANSMVPSVNVVVVDDEGAILMIRRSDTGSWALPGGAIDIGESVREAAVRETKEETGIECEITGLCGVYSDPGHVIHYTSDNEVRQEFSLVLTAQPIGGSITVSEESLEVRWIAPETIGSLAMDPSMRRRIEDYLSPGDAVVVT